MAWVFAWPAVRNSTGALNTRRPLPFLAQIQRAFGGHDVTAVRAHTGEHAGVAARGMPRSGA